MAVLTYIEAMNQAFKEEMRRDERVVMWGEDLISMHGVYGFTAGIHEELGDDRIEDTPICEQAIAGMAIGAAHRGLRPIGVFMNSGFSLAAFDGLFLKIGCTRPGLPIVMQASIAGPGKIWITAYHRKPSMPIPPTGKSSCPLHPMTSKG